jgi:hypothetical protein
MRLSPFLPALLLSLAALPALAHSPSPNADCNIVQDETFRILGIAVSVTVPGPQTVDAGVARVYVNGLQTVSVTVAGTTVTLSLANLPAGTYWLGKDLHLYAETNGWTGVQTHAHTCTLHPHGERGGVTVPADTRAL